jgi:hypothetical protein
MDFMIVFHGVDKSTAQIARELDLNKDDLHFMTEHLRNGIAKKKSL